MTAPDAPFTQPLQDEAPVVSVVMGSYSDWPVMRQAAEALRALGVPVEVPAPREYVALGAARQAARAVLPNSTETRIVVTGNYRSWRHFIGMRAAEHADPEIRRIAVRSLRLLQQSVPEVFEDFSITTLRDGGEMATSPYVSDI